MHNKWPDKFRNAALFFAVLSFLCTSLLFLNASAQISGSKAREVLQRKTGAEQGGVAGTEEASLQKQRTPSAALQQALEVQALEGVIDDSTYVVGPGDIFVAAVLESPEIRYEIPVSPTGELVIPGVGMIEAAGHTLAEVKQSASELAKTKYKLGTLKVFLFKLRPIRVHVVGEVNFPNTYFATPVDRVSRLLEIAGGLTDWADPRFIEIRHKDGTVSKFNYSKYIHTGDFSENILLKAGDIIFVPSMSPKSPFVRVESLPEVSGYYQVRGHETLWQFLRRLSQKSRGLQIEQTKILRKVGDEQVWIRFRGGQTVSSSSTGDKPGDLERVIGPSDTLCSGDVLYIPWINPQVYVSGAVQTPGPFPFMEGGTALDYVGMAGGVVQAADISKVKVYHVTSNSWATGPTVRVDRGDLVVVPELARKRWLDYLSLTSGLASLVIAAKAAGVIK